MRLTPRTVVFRVPFSTSPWNQMSCSLSFSLTHTASRTYMSHHHTSNSTRQTFKRVITQRDQNHQRTFGTKSQTSSRSSGPISPSPSGAPSSSPSQSTANSGELVSLDCVDRLVEKRESMDDPELECEARGFRGEDEALLGVLPDATRKRRGVRVTEGDSDIVSVRVKSCG